MRPFKIWTMAVYVAVGLFAWANQGHAAEGKPSDKPPGKEVRLPDATAAWNRRLPDLFIDGLSLDEIVGMLRSEFPELNFIIKPDEDGLLASLSIHLKLRAVTLDELLRGLQLAYEGSVQIRFGDAPEAGLDHTENERLVIFERPRPKTAGHPGPPENPTAPSPAKPQIVTRAYNLSRYLDRATLKETEQAMRNLEEVIAVAGDMTKSAIKGGRSFHPALNLHQGTKLMIVVGRPDELEIVDQIVRELQGTPIGSSIAPSPSRAGAADPSQNQNINAPVKH